MRIGILTSGGDAPGMNAAIRAAVRCGTDLGLEMVGVRRGFDGLIDGDFIPLDNRAVGGIIERGGTILRTARSAEFLTPEGREKALEQIDRNSLDGLIVIGGNGSLRGARWLSEEGVNTVGIPASIDNDIPHTTMAMGVDTALNTVVESLNKIRDTAISHGRAFVVEVMGRKSGYIALMGGLAGGAEVVLIPEVPVSLDDVARTVADGRRRGKHHSIIVVAEGFAPTDRPLDGESAGHAVAAHLEGTETIETRLTILGHVQRGGSPTAFDRILASRLAASSSSWLAAGKGGVFAGLDRDKVVAVPLSAMDEEPANVDLDLYRLVGVIST